NSPSSTSAWSRSSTDATSLATPPPTANATVAGATSRSIQRPTVFSYAAVAATTRRRSRVRMRLLEANLLTRVGVCGLVALLLLGGSTPVAAQRPSRSPEELAMDGAEALRAKRYREAFDAFAAAAQLRPRDVTLYFGAALSASLFGQ